MEKGMKEAVEKAVSRKEFYEDLEAFAKEEIQKVAKHNGGVTMTASFSGVYNMGRFGHKDKNTIDICGWTSLCYKNTNRRVFVTFSLAKESEYKEKIAAKIKDLFSILDRQFKNKQIEKSDTEKKVAKLKKQFKAEEVIPGKWGTYTLVYEDGDTKIKINSKNEVEAIDFYTPKKTVAETIKWLKL